MLLLTGKVLVLLNEPLFEKKIIYQHSIRKLTEKLHRSRRLAETCQNWTKYVYIFKS